MMKFMLIAGARPNFMKIASVINAIQEHNEQQGCLNPIDFILVHTGQHYDEVMSGVFFADLGIPQPHINLEVGSLSHAGQTAEIMKRFEPVLVQEQPDVVIVVGDVTSTIACALVASKIVYPATRNSQPAARNLRPAIAHVEAGLRSFDRTMPEEINRVLTDSISDLLFTTEESANINLRAEGIPDEKVYFVGNTMIDTLLNHREKANQSKILYNLGLIGPQPETRNSQLATRNSQLATRNSQLATRNSQPATRNSQLATRNLQPISYCLLTLHRPSNVDDQKTFIEILEALTTIAKEIPVIFPAHPRTMNRIEEFGLENYFDFSIRNPKSEIRNKSIRCLEPLGYIDFLCLMSNATLVLTDSGGMQEETTILGIPCITLRKNTERPVTVTHGTNVVAGTKKEAIIKCANSQLKKYSQLKLMNNQNPEIQNPKSEIQNFKFPPPPLWDGEAGKRIIKVLIVEHLS